MHARTLSVVLLLACGGRADRRDRVAADGSDAGGTRTTARLDEAA